MPDRVKTVRHGTPRAYPFDDELPNFVVKRESFLGQDHQHAKGDAAVLPRSMCAAANSSVVGLGEIPHGRLELLHLPTALDPPTQVQSSLECQRIIPRLFDFAKILGQLFFVSAQPQSSAGSTIGLTM